MISHVVLPYITMITENVEQLFMCLLAISVLSLEKCLFSPFGHFFNQAVWFFEVQLYTFLGFSQVSNGECRNIVSKETQ